MPFVCPECSRGGSLRIALSIELPPDSRSDEITLQIVECSECGFCGLAVYEESRRGALDTESVHHTGYYAAGNQLRSVRRAIRSCPQPRSSKCRCQAHRTLGKTDASGRWNGLQDLETTGCFEIKA
jgi:hypothetical protein